MGGRGASSGANPQQVTMEQYIMMNNVEKIRKETDAIRATMDKSDMGSGGKVSAMPKKKKCSCCEEYTLPRHSQYAICDICGWIDDPFQNKHPDSLDGRNALALNQARKKYKQENDE